MKNKIKKSAINLFYKKGYFATSMSAISNATGIGKSSIYHHYPTKEDILLDIFRTTMKDLQEMLEKRLREVIDTESKIKAFINCHIVFQIEPSGPVKEVTYYYTNLYHGTCPKAFVVTSEAELDDLTPAFILAAPYDSLLRILSGELDPMQAMITRKLRVKGNMAYMMRNVPTVLEFVRCAKEIETDFLE